MMAGMPVIVTGVALAVPVVVASGVGGIAKGSFHQGMGSLIRFPGDTGEELDAGLRQCVLSSHADAAANQRIYPGFLPWPLVPTTCSEVSLPSLVS